MVPLMVLKQSNGNWGSMNGGKIDGTLAKDNPMRTLKKVVEMITTRTDF